MFLLSGEKSPQAAAVNIRLEYGAKLPTGPNALLKKGPAGFVCVCRCVVVVGIYVHRLYPCVVLFEV